jgi:cobalt-zinc-cadmium efflux system outer membrane protein
MVFLQTLLACGVGAAALTVLPGATADVGSNTANLSVGGPTPKPLTLVQAQQLAFERNWDLLASAAGVDLATAQKLIARQFPNPTLALSTLKINVDGHPNSTPEGNGFWERSYDTIFAVNQLFEVGGKRRNRKLSAQASFEAARAQYLDAHRVLSLGVAKAYVAAAFASENAQILLQSAETLRKEAEVADVRLKAGEISASDKQQIEITAERFRLDAEAAKSASTQARIALEVLLGVSHPQGEISLADQLEQLASRPVPGPETDGSMRPDVLAAEAAWRRAEAELRLQKANRIPDPTVLAQYEHEPPDSPNSIGLGVSFPLPLWNRNQGNILGAKAALAQARLGYDKARTQALAEIATARVVYQNASRRWQDYREIITRKSEQVRQTLSYAYQKGGASLLDMLIAERNDNEIRQAALQAASDTAVALASLQAANEEIQPSTLKK